MVEGTILAGDVAGIGAALISAQREAVKQQKRAEAAERELTAMAARCGELKEALRSMVIEAGEGGSKSAYRAVDLISRKTMDKAKTALAQPLPARAAAMGEVIEKGQVLFDLSNKMEDGISLDSPEWGLAWREFWDACDALAKTEARDG